MGRSVGGVKTTKQNILQSGVRLLAGIAVALIFSVATGHASTRWATLEAIHCLENPRDLTRPGARGELGAYQFRAATWRMHTSVPFARAIDRRVSDDVAIRHYEWLKRGLEGAGLMATPYNIALAWNGGLEAVVRGCSPAVAHDYAQRATNLASGFDRPVAASGR